MSVAIIRGILEMNIMSVLYILFSVILPSKYLAIDWGNFKINNPPPYNRNFGNLEEMIIQLYQKDITTHEIVAIIEKMYGCYYSPQTIFNMTQVVAEEVDAFHNLPSPSQFAVVYLDATFITVKRGTAPKEALHVLIGITPSGEKSIIDYGIYPSKNTLAYKELLDYAKQRG